MRKKRHGIIRTFKKHLFHNSKISSESSSKYFTLSSEHNRKKRPNFFEMRISLSSKISLLIYLIMFTLFLQLHLSLLYFYYILYEKFAELESLERFLIYCESTLFIVHLNAALSYGHNHKNMSSRVSV